VSAELPAFASGAAPQEPGRPCLPVTRGTAVRALVRGASLTSLRYSFQINPFRIDRATVARSKSDWNGKLSPIRSIGTAGT
jgi:hypothetical protein